MEALGDTLWAFLMSSGSGAMKLGSGSPKDTAMLIWTIVKLVLTFVEIVEIGDKVNNLGRGYSGIYRTFPSNYEIKGWDRYELTIYLWSQSSVGSNIAGLLLAVLIPWIGEDIKRSIKEAKLRQKQKGFPQKSVLSDRSPGHHKPQGLPVGPLWGRGGTRNAGLGPFLTPNAGSENRCFGGVVGVSWLPGGCSRRLLWALLGQPATWRLALWWVPKLHCVKRALDGPGGFWSRSRAAAGGAVGSGAAFKAIIVNIIGSNGSKCYRTYWRPGMHAHGLGTPLRAQI